MLALSVEPQYDSVAGGTSGREEPDQNLVILAQVGKCFPAVASISLDRYLPRPSGPDRNAWRVAPRVSRSSLRQPPRPPQESGTGQDRSPCHNR